MKLLDRLFGRRAEPEEVETAECRHLQLAPRWEDAEAMGDSSRISSYQCTACGASFTPEQAKEFAPTD